jgi:hypothetical protein
VEFTHLKVERWRKKQEPAFRPAFCIKSTCPLIIVAAEQAVVAEQFRLLPAWAKSLLHPELRLAQVA